MSGEGVVEAYKVPSWAEELAIQPKWRTTLCLKPTPIHRWNLPGTPPGFEVAVKRDDLTGCLFSGNKIRKLDFFFGEAISKKCDCVITLGGVGSNHARATALGSRQLGLDSHLFLFTRTEPVKDVPCKGNYLLNRLSGANIYLHARSVRKPFDELSRILEHFHEKLKSEGHSPYIIPPGGASPIGTWGYIDAWQEMMEQGVLDDYDDVVVAAGSLGTVCGLAIANHLTGSKLRIHGVAIGFPADVCYSMVQKELDLFGMKVTARDLLNIIGDYFKEFYQKCTEDEFRFIIEVMSKTGLSLDPVYTVKAIRGMLTEMKERPHIFKGKRILFIHTGGIFGLFDGRIEDQVVSMMDNNVKEASEVLPDFVW